MYSPLQVKEKYNLMRQQEVTLQALLEAVATIFKLIHHEDVPILQLLGEYDTTHA